MVALTHIVCALLLTTKQVLSASNARYQTPGSDGLAPFLVPHKVGIKLPQSLESGMAFQIDAFLQSGQVRGTFSFANANVPNDVALHVALDGPDTKVRLNTRIGGKWTPDVFLDFYQNNVTYPASPSTPDRRKFCLEIRFVPTNKKGAGYFKFKFHNQNTIMSNGEKLEPYVAKFDKPDDIIAKGIMSNYLWLENWYFKGPTGGFSELQVTPLNFP
ncbi:hypothetical protein Dda_4869 [Drechslerella dactyloides]|uniref:Galectin n=1 Tax=Drechslerella dactyloides TaxID=74499 RepID=A0AAD6IYH5_DREDA|nr:hypothetical protein Dda_4869 [Drechslerella dactyloides]